MDDDRLPLGPPDAEVAIALGRPEWPHDDELTVLAVTVEGSGVQARVVVESIDGAEGRESGVQLGAFLRDLGSTPKPWDGERVWRSLADQLRVAVTCDRLGHATVVVTLHATPWCPSWSVTATFVHPLGDLIALGDAVDVWFRPPAG